MAHHSSERPLGNENPELKKQLEKATKQATNRMAASDMQPGSSAAFKNMFGNLGATGEYPEGQLGKWDEGALRFAVGAEGGKILIDFGKSVRSLGLDPEHAEALAQSLMEKARIARNQRK